MHVQVEVQCKLDTAIVMRGVHGWYKAHIALCTFIDRTEGMVGTKHTLYKALRTRLWALLLLSDEA